MFLFIFESFGTSELILIGIVALIVFGPRKLPQMARTIGKTMADFRKTTHEFKSTWEKEVDFAETGSVNKNYDNDIKPIENAVEPERKQIAENNAIVSPEIKEISSAEAEKILALEKDTAKETQPEKNENDKRSWL
jgi:sec-independent protein translocase protein TatA